MTTFKYFKQNINIKTPSLFLQSAVKVSAKSLLKTNK